MTRVEDHYLFIHSDNASLAQKRPLNCLIECELSVYNYDVSLFCLLVERKSRYVRLLW